MSPQEGQGIPNNLFIGQSLGPFSKMGEPKKEAARIKPVRIMTSRRLRTKPSQITGQANSCISVERKVLSPEEPPRGMLSEGAGKSKDTEQRLSTLNCKL